MLAEAGGSGARGDAGSRSCGPSDCFAATAYTDWLGDATVTAPLMDNRVGEVLPIGVIASGL